MHTPMNTTVHRIIQKNFVKIALAIFFPLIAGWLQWSLWNVYLAPYTWQLFYPAVFFSVWVGGLSGGLIAMVISLNLGIYLFIDPVFSLEIQDTKQLHSAFIFTLNCMLFCWLRWLFQKGPKNNNFNTSTIEQTQARLKLALKSAHAGLWEWNTQTNENVWSDEIWELYNLTPFCSKPSFELWYSTVSNADKERVRSIVNEAASLGKDIFLEWRLAIQPEGKTKWLMAIGEAQEATPQKPLTYRCIVIDITNLKTAELTLSSREQMLELALSTLHAEAWQIDTDKKQLVRTSQYDHIFGYGEAKTIWDIRAFIKHVYLNDKAQVLITLRDSIENNSTFDIECRIVRKDNEIRWIHIKGFPQPSIGNRSVKFSGIIQDITENKRLTHDLKRWADAFYYCAHGIVIADPKTNTLSFCNPAFAAIEGYDSHKDCEGLSILSLYPQDERARIKTFINTADEIGKAQYETRHIRKDKKIIDVHVTLASVKNENNEILYRVAAVQDISERKKIELANREMEKRLRILIDQAAPEPVFLHDHFGKILDVNQKACDSLGYSKAELLSLSVFDLETDFNLPSAQAVWESIQPGQSVLLYGHHRKKDGNIFPVEISFGLLLENKQRLYIVFVRDISERVKAEEQLSIQSKALESAANAIMIVSPEGYIEWVNPAFCQLTGYGLDEAIGTTTDALFKCKEHQPEVHKAIWDTIRGGQIWHGELQLPRKDGTFCMEEQTVTPVCDPQGNILHYIAIKQDIRERKLNEEKLKQYQNHLEQVVEERTIELITAKEEALRHAEVKSAFLANMSHEIRSPMNAMLGYFYLLEQHALDKEAENLVRKARSAGQSLLGIINDILDFSKIEAGHLQIEQAPFRMDSVLDQVAAVMTATVGNKAIELVINSDLKQSQYFLGDSLRLQQILVNLTSNAIKFTDRGFVELTIKTKRKINPQQCMLEFSVADSGIGISQYKLHEIFNAFTQEDTSISRRFGGSGLGLTISSKLVSLMGGKLRVESQPNQGSRFWFDLTLTLDNTQRIDQAILNNIQILIADDCEITRSAMVNLAQSMGWDADSVSTGEGAYLQAMSKYAENKPYDVILLNWKMPGIDGLSAAKAIKQDFILNNLATATPPFIIMVPACSREEIHRQNQLENLDLVVTKPVTPTALYEAVSALMQKNIVNTPKVNAKAQENLVLKDIVILVVDDSDLNQEIAKNILELHGAKVSVSSNGRDAIQWLFDEDNQADIVLMDVQMPDMNGYDTTKIIKNNPAFKNLPVVALTAGVFKEDQEIAQAAGMDDFVAKPFNVEQLVAVIQRLTKNGNPGNKIGMPEILPPLPAVGEPAAIKTSTFVSIDFSVGLNLIGDKNLYFSYLSRFVDSYANVGYELSNLIHLHKYSEAAGLAHKLKGISANLALTEIRHHANEIECSLKKGDYAEIDCKALINAIDQVSITIRELIGQITTDEDKTQCRLSNHFDKAALLAMLNKLLTLLDKDNPALIEPLIADIKPILPSTDFTRIKDQISEFDFQNTKKTVSDLIQKYC